MSAVHSQYECRCEVPRPLIHIGEDTGLCGICNFIYDESLYEMRLRQHVAGWTHDTLDEFLAAVDPEYRKLQQV